MYINTSPYSLVLAFQNPNMAGIVILSTVFILLAGVLYVKKRMMKWALGVLATASVYILWLTNNRGSIVSLVVFLFLFLVFRKQSRIPRVLSVVLILLPFLTILSYNILSFYIPEGTIFLDKPFDSGRISIWAGLIEEIEENPFDVHAMESGGLNIAIAGIIEFGFIGYLAFTAMLLAMNPPGNVPGRANYRQVAYLAFLCIFIQQSFENTLVLGSYGVYIFSYALLGIAFSKDAAGAVRVVPTPRG